MLALYQLSYLSRSMLAVSLCCQYLCSECQSVQTLAATDPTHVIFVLRICAIPQRQCSCKCSVKFMRTTLQFFDWSCWLANRKPPLLPNRRLLLQFTEFLWGSLLMLYSALYVCGASRIKLSARFRRICDEIKQNKSASNAGHIYLLIYLKRA